MKPNTDDQLVIRSRDRHYQIISMTSSTNPMRWPGRIERALGECIHRGRRVAAVAASVALSIVVTFGTAAIFLHQYLRFAEYYYNFLGSTLLVKSRLEEKK